MKHAVVAGRIARLLVMRLCPFPPRRKKASAEILSRYVQNKVEAHTPLFIALAINALIFGLCGAVAVSARERDRSDEISASIGMLTEAEPHRPPAGGSSTAVDVSVANMVNSAVPSTGSVRMIDGIAVSAPREFSLEVSALGALPIAEPNSGGEGGGNGPAAGSSPGRSHFGRSGFGQDGEKGKVNGMAVKAERLGVVVDDSGSMELELPNVFADIQAGFPGALIARVDGCYVNQVGPGKPIEPLVERVLTAGKAHGTALRTPRDASVEEAIVGLVLVDRCDAIYWYTDLRDSQIEGGMGALAAFLKEHNVRWYLRSSAGKPWPEQADPILATGGDFDWPGKAKEEKARAKLEGK